jgi:hypothetical protein
MKPRNRSTLIAALAILLGGAFAPAFGAKKKQYRYTVGWDFWDDRNSNNNAWSRMDIRLNGKSVGRFQEGFKQLEGLPVKRGEHIKLDMPARPHDGRSFPGHWASRFVHRWMEKGALVDWYEGGKRYELHTVTWTDFIRCDEYVRTMDEVTWIVDGKTIGRKDAFLKFIEPWSGKTDLVIQLLVPLKWAPGGAPVDWGDTMTSLELLSDGKKIRKYRIEWVPIDPPEPAK